MCSKRGSNATPFWQNIVMADREHVEIALGSLERALRGTDRLRAEEATLGLVDMLDRVSVAPHLIQVLRAEVSAMQTALDANSFERALEAAGRARSALRDSSDSR